MIGFMMGPQGSGKGTQAALVEGDFGFVHCSMGDMLKAERNNETKEGKIIENAQLKGKLVPEEITNKIAKKAIHENKNVLFDGYPRNMAQAEFLIKNRYRIEFVILVEIGEDESVKRLGKRRICTATNKIYTDGKITEQEIEECENAGGKIITRNDDMPEAIKKRLSIYHEKTRPLVSLFREKEASIIKINGEQSIEDVHRDIKDELSEIIS